MEHRSTVASIVHTVFTVHCSVVLRCTKLQCTMDFPYCMHSESAQRAKTSTAQRHSFVRVSGICTLPIALPFCSLHSHNYHLSIKFSQLTLKTMFVRSTVGSCALLGTRHQIGSIIFHIRCWCCGCDAISLE